jgi:serine O-acetyltransferase
MILSIIVKCLGGTWALKERCRRSTSGIAGKFNEFLYIRSLQAKGSWISWDSHFDSIPCFPHGIYGIFISGGVRIGRDCVIFQQVTIGSNTLIDSRRFGAPVIGDKCYIGAGAKIIGRVRIGNNVRIGANAAVFQDIPDNCVVTLGEMRLSAKPSKLNNRFYHIYNDKWRYYENGQWSYEDDPDKVAILDRGFDRKT